jgi:hypothetical protein
MTKTNGNNSEKTYVLTYITDETKQRWIQHIQKIRPKYNSMSHFLEDAAEYKIQADTYPLNKMIGAVGPVRR